MYSPPERSTPCSVTTLPAEFTSWFPWTWIDSVDVAAATRTPNVCANEATARAAMAMPARCFTTPRWVRGRRAAIRVSRVGVCRLVGHLPPARWTSHTFPAPLRWWALLPRLVAEALPLPLRSRGLAATRPSPRRDPLPMIGHHLPPGLREAGVAHPRCRWRP